MTTEPLNRMEKNLTRICDAIAQLQQGRSNSHGSFTLGTGVTSTVVTSRTCSTGTDVSVTPLTANAGNIIRTADFWIVPGNGSFTVHHANTANADCNFTYSVNG